MKTMKIQKTFMSISLILIGILFIPNYGISQEKEKKRVHIKKVKMENGKETVMDTTIHISDLEKLEELDELGIILEEDMESLKNLDVDVFVSEGEEGEEEYNVTIKSDGEGEMKNFVFISDDGELEELKVDGGKYVYLTKSDGGEVESTIEVFDGDEVNWTTDMEMEVEVEDLENGNKKVTIKKEDGETVEHILDEGKGVYMIDENGELTKLEDDKDLEWNAEGDKDRILITVGDDKDGDIMVIRNKNETIDMVNPGNNQRIMVKETDGDGDTQVHVRVMEEKDGDKSIIIKTRVIVQKLSDNEIQTLKDAGVDLEGETGLEKLELDDLNFHPNPNDGKFKLSFETPEKGNTNIRIFDVNGKEVYSEKINNFNGRYENTIDISENKKGTYFLHIQQGKKVSTRKIVLE